MTKICNNLLGAKNNDSHSEKQAIVKFYTMEYRKCGNFNSKNDSRPCMGASVFLKSVDFTAFAVNVKTIAPIQKLYQSGHAIWWATMPMPVYSFLEEYDFSGKTIVSFSSHGGTMFGDSVSDLSKAAPGAYVGLGYEFNYSSSDRDEISQWLALNGVPEQ